MTGDLPYDDAVLRAHGIGGGAALPVPADLAIAGAAAAIAVSFTVLALAWRSSRYDDTDRGLALPAVVGRGVDATATTLLLRLLGLVAFAYVVWAAVLGPDLLINPVFGIVYVLVWVGLVPASLLLGTVWRRLSPMRSITVVIARLAGTDPEQGLVRYPGWLGLWPAALTLLGFVWLELVSPASTQLEHLRLWGAGYVALMLVGGVVFGTRWLAHADPFEVYSTLVARLSVWGRAPGRRDGDVGGTLVVRSPLANLARTGTTPGLLAVVSVLFGSTAFDSFSGSTTWVGYLQSASVSPVLLETVVLLAFCVAVGALFSISCRMTRTLGHLSPAELPRRMAHSVVPIIVGYVVAHYLAYFVQQGQQTLVYMSDPMATGADLLGTADLTVSFWLTYHPTVLATVKVLAVVLGHVLAVIASHDRAVGLLPRRYQLTGQLPLLAVMVVFTVGGLYLLFVA